MSGNSNVIATFRICVVNSYTLTVSGTSVVTDSRIGDSLLRAIGRAKGVKRCEYTHTNGIGIDLTGDISAILAAQSVCRKIQAFFRSRRQFAKVAIV